MMDEYDKLPLSPQGREIWNAFKQELDIYRGLRDKTIVYVKQNDYPNAEKSLGDVTKAREVMFVSLDKLVHMNQDMAKRAMRVITVYSNN